MANRIRLGKFQTTPFNYVQGMLTENHIAAFFRKFPQKASNIMVQLLAAKQGKSLESFLSQFPTKEFNDDEEYTWDVVGSARRNIALVEARDFDGNKIASGMVGANTEPFYLVFNEAWFGDGEYIVGNLNEVYPMRILGDPRMEGTQAVDLYAA